MSEIGSKVQFARYTKRQMNDRDALIQTIQKLETKT